MNDSLPADLRIGLTGGIASGKTAVADLLGELGATLIDTDIIARDVVAPGKPGLDAVVAAFGADICQPDGSLDRTALRAGIFAEPGLRQQLDDILHPLIRAATLQQIQATSGTGPYQVIVVPLLIESGFAELVDRILVVDCTELTQKQRLIARDGSTEAEADAIIAAQASREERLALADDVVVNDADIGALKPAVQALHERYLTLAAH